MGGGDNSGGAWRDGPGGWGSRRPGDWYSPEDIRQFREEARRWIGQGRELRDVLRQQNIDPRELDEILKRLRELEDGRNYRDANELLRLQEQVAEGLKRFEYGLRRKVGDEADRALVSGSDEVPQEFRKLVEEYYRSLSKGKQ
jgi:DNA repair ATPase RecN